MLIELYHQASKLSREFNQKHSSTVNICLDKQQMAVWFVYFDYGWCFLRRIDDGNWLYKKKKVEPHYHMRFNLFLLPFWRTERDSNIIK